MTKVKNPFITSHFLTNSFHSIFDNNLLPFFIKKVEKGDVIFHSNSSHKYSYYVKSGIIKNYIINPCGKEKVLFFYKTGGLFGFQNINTKKLTITEAVAVMDCELYQFEYEIFHEFIRNSPEYYTVFLEYIFNMMILKTEEVIELSFYTVIERLSELLLILAEEHQRNKVISELTLIPYNNEEFSCMLGVCRNSISNALAILQEQNIIEKKRNGIIIKDLKRLKDFITQE